VAAWTRSTRLELRGHPAQSIAVDSILSWVTVERTIRYPFKGYAPRWGWGGLNGSAAPPAQIRSCFLVQLQKDGVACRRLKPRRGRGDRGGCLGLSCGAYGCGSAVPVVIKFRIPRFRWRRCQRLEVGRVEGCTDVSYGPGGGSERTCARLRRGASGARRGAPTITSDGWKMACPSVSHSAIKRVRG
jgi:hypothetical protein